MSQMARNLTDGLDGFLSGGGYLIDDRASLVAVATSLTPRLDRSNLGLVKLHLNQ